MENETDNQNNGNSNIIFIIGFLILLMFIILAIKGFFFPDITYD